MRREATRINRAIISSSLALLLPSMQLLLISLEYAFGTFSGNGVYSLSSVRALRSAGHSVRVVAGAPPGHAAGAGLADDAFALPLPTWGRLDRHSAHAAFAAAAGSDSALHAWLSAAPPPQLVLGVDFTSLGAYRALRLAAPLVYLNWRVYTLTDPEHRALEAEAAAASAATIALSHVDAAAIRSLLGATRPVHVVPCPLREETRALAGADPPAETGRTLLACVVRLSAEKAPERFVALVQALAERGTLQRLGIRPCMVGAARDDFARDLVARLLAAAPQALVITDFLSPAELGRRVFAHTALNLHPPLYESFGLTVLEAAAWGAPTLMHAPASEAQGVGAAEVLSAARGESLALDLALPPPQLAQLVEAALADGPALRRVAAKARAVALAATEAANAAATGAVLAEVLASAAAQRSEL